jgi:flagellar hook-basal body complex protein FliE
MMSIASIMSKVLPGSFAPDMSAAEMPTIAPIPGQTNLPDTPSAGDSAASGSAAVGGVTSFKDTVKSLLSDVNASINTSDQNARDLASGKTADVNKVITSVEEANLALQYTMAIRTKLLDAYSEVERMAV